MRARGVWPARPCEQIVASAMPSLSCLDCWEPVGYCLEDTAERVFLAAGGAAAAGDSDAADMEAEAGFWQCAACTFANRDLRAQRCDACDTPRPGRRSER